MTPRILGTLAAALAVSAIAVVSPPASAAPAGVDPDRPLGTLWYPGPYQPPEAAPAPAPRAPAPVVAPPVSRPAPAAIVPTPPPVGAPRPETPLGTLWYPGPYDPNRPSAVPAPAASPTPPTSRVPDDKPLGTLWYPGPYQPGATYRPTPVPAQETPREVAPAPRATAPKAAGTTTPRARPQRSGQVKSGEELPVHLSADEMSYDQEHGVVTATGNVEIHHGERRLRADSVTYNQKTDIVTATGNISLVEPGGERIFADRMEITGDLRDAVVEAVGILLTDRSRMAAAGARHSAGLITEMSRGVYSPCNLCAKDPTRPPLWQLKAVKIVHDKSAKTIEYRDAWLEVFGIPVAYTPYFSHPDPTVRRRSGLLAPSFGGSSDLGFVLRVPYYFNISPQQDATVTAIATTEGGDGAAGEYRHRFMKGTLNATGSLIGGDSEKDVRGHIDAKGRFDIDDTWRLGFDANRATDDTYLRRYGFGSPESLNSRLFLEGFRKRNYFAINGYAFQGLRAQDDPGLEPLVLPQIDFNHVGEVDRFGGETSLDVNLLSLTRSDGTDTRRLSIRPAWQRPFIGPLGDLYKVAFALNGDFYYTDDLDRLGKTQYTGFSNRIVPQVMFDWRYPLIRPGSTFNHVIEPIVVAFYSPNGGNPAEIPNEDSRELEFDDTNLFSPNKFSGIDRIESGPRISYGVKWGVYGNGGGSTSFFVGQSYRPRTDDTFSIGSGLEEKFSDIVARVRISPADYLRLIYRTRFASDNFTPKRNEVSFSAGVPAFNVGAGYLFLEPTQGSEFPGREEITYSASSQLNRSWRVSFNGINDLALSETRVLGAQLTYENECIVVTTDARRTFYQDRDFKPDDQIVLRVVFKTLGEVHTGISP